MWWNDQNLNKPQKDSAGRSWNFRVWHDFVDGVPVQRIFFWDDDQRETGLLEFSGDRTLTATQIKQRIARLLHNATFRRQCHHVLKFPVERYY